MAIQKTDSKKVSTTPKSDAAQAAVGQATSLGTVNQTKNNNKININTNSVGSTTTPTVDTATTAQAKPAISSEELASMYSIPLAVINSDPELKALFDKAWSAEKSGQAWSQEYFTVQLRNTGWYKAKTESQRKYYLLANDPAQAAEFAAQLARSKATVADSAGLLGSTLNDAQLTELAKNNLQFGFNESELRNTIATYISFEGKTDQEIIGSLYGDAGNYEDQIRQWAKDNNVTVSNDWVLGQVKGIVSNDFTVDKSKDYITTIARQQYSGWSDKLDSTTSLLDLSAGYRQLISSEMDTSFDNIDFSNEFLNSAMSATDQSGKPITNDALRVTLRKSDEWADVSKNKDAVIGVANDILSRFGMM